MILTKKIKKYGDAFVITLTREEREVLDLREGDIVNVEMEVIQFGN